MFALFSPQIIFVLQKKSNYIVDCCLITHFICIPFDLIQDTLFPLKHGSLYNPYVVEEDATYYFAKDRIIL